MQHHQLPPSSVPRLLTLASLTQHQNVLPFCEFRYIKLLNQVRVLPSLLRQLAMTKLAVLMLHWAHSHQRTFALVCTILLLHLYAMTFADAATVRPLSYPGRSRSADGLTQKMKNTEPSGHRSSLSLKSNSQIDPQRITDHECFTLKNDYSCSNHNDCHWCSPWCIYSGAYTKVACDKYNETAPKVHQIIPQQVLEGVPTLIIIIGVNLNNSNNSLEQIEFDFSTKTQTCDIINRTDEQIRCILEGVDGVTSQKVEPKLRYNVSLMGNTISHAFDGGDWIEFITEREHVYEPDEQTSVWDNLHNLHYVAAFLAVFGVVASFSSLLYARRKQARLLFETVERMVLMQRMKKTLLKKGLYVEYTTVQLKTKLGDGNFGEVYRAAVTTDKQTMEVAIKKLKKGSELAKIKMFITEGIRMSTFRHERILSPVAITLDSANQMPSIVLPIMANGDLCRYLRKNKVFPIVKLLTFALQIAEGVEYLSTINMVHGDLAARNCLLDEKYQIKIGDFGLSRQMYRTDYVTINDIYRPIRWMALECLASKKPRFTLKSDVWSFGVVLWEIFTLGSYPYEEFDNWDLVKHVEGGYRLHRPLNCPTMAYALMAKCWSVQASDRPSIGELKTQLNATLQAIVQEVNGQAGLAHSSVRDHLSYTSLADRFVQSRRISSQSTMSSRSDQSTASSATHHSALGHWA